MTAQCRLCKANGSFTFRKVDKDSKKLIGADNLYVTLCRDCHKRETQMKKDKAYDGDPTHVDIKIEKEDDQIDSKSRKPWFDIAQSERDTQLMMKERANSAV